MNVLLIGAGKHAHVVADILAAAKCNVSGVIAPDDQMIFGLPNLGTDEDLPRFAGWGFIAAIGDNRVRKQVYERACAAGLTPISAVHPSAALMRNAEVGPGTVIMPHVTLEVGARIGANCIINSNSSIGHNGSIGAHTHICPGCTITGSSVIGEGALLGAGCMTVPEAQIGDWAQVGAGSVVVKPIAPALKSIPRAKKRPIRTLVYAPVVGRGGMHRLMTRLVETFVKIAPAHEFQFQVLGQSVDEIGQPIVWDAPLIELQPSPLPRHPHLFGYLPQVMPLYVDQLIAMQDQADLVYIPNPFWTQRVQQWRLQIPLVATIADFAFDMIDLGIVTEGFRTDARLLVDRARRVVFPSEFQRRWGVEYYGFNQTEVIYHAEFLPEPYLPTPEEAERVRAKYGLPAQYILAFHPMYHKDPVTILRGQHFARQTHPSVPPLVLAGIGTEHLQQTGKYDDHHLQAVRQAVTAEQYTLGTDLFVLGQVPDADIAGLYKGAVAAVSATTSEAGLNATAFEAFAAAVPLIYSDIAPMTERLGRERYGYCFSVGDAAALADCIVAACSQPDEARRRALAGFAFTNRRAWRDVAEDYLQVFREALL